MDYVEGMALRQRTNAAMALLDHVAARADLAFAQAHGGNSRERSKSNPNRWGDGYSAVAKRTALVCTRLRNLVKSAYKQRLDDADTMRAILTSDGIEIGDVHREAGVVVAEAKAALKRERKLLRGRKRKQYILQGELPKRRFVALRVATGACCDDRFLWRKAFRGKSFSGLWSTAVWGLIASRRKLQRRGFVCSKP